MFPDIPAPSTHPQWIDAELRLVGGLDGRMIGLLQAIQDTGSINQAAKQAGLSYKGAWQIIERANNLAPKVLISTATGGSKGGGTVLTPAGQAFLALYYRLQQQHQQFLEQLNLELSNDPEMALLFKNMTVKSSASNQLLGKVTDIHTGMVSSELSVRLKGGEQVIATMSQAEFELLALKKGDDVLVLIAIAEISVVLEESSPVLLSARNALTGTVIRMQNEGVDSAVVIRLPSGDTLTASITQSSADALDLKAGMSVMAVFKSNALLLGAAGNLLIRDWKAQATALPGYGHAQPVKPCRINDLVEIKGIE